MKRISQPSVLNFFEKKKKSESRTTLQINQPSSLFVSDPTDPEASSPSEKVSSVEGEQELLFENDVGIYLGNPPTDNEKKFKVFQNPWMPPLSYKFPVSDKRRLSFQRHWMEQYSWLVFSDVAKGALCKVCVLFGRNHGGRGGQELRSLVAIPFINWKKAKQIFYSHTLRGKNETGKIGLTEPPYNDGNFRAILRFRARSGDHFLKEHILSQTSDSRSMFTSPTIQNEIIDLCGNFIQENVVNRIKYAGFFTILADETQDISRYEQLALCIRYVDDSSADNVFIREDFLEFVHVKDVTASALATTIMQCIMTLGLDMEMLVGQGYDGAAVMSGQFRGVRTIISEKYPKAQFIHCSAHTLNLVLAHSCEIPMIRNCIGTIKTVINFFRQSALRDGLLKDAAESAGAIHLNLVSLCETRWTEKHLAVERFAEMFSVVTEALQALQDSRRECASQAYQLKQAIENSQFVVSMLILRKVFSFTSTLNKILQTQNIDLTEACKYVDIVKKTLEDIRNDDEFLKIVTDSKEYLGIESLTAPRITNRQKGRSNNPAETAEIYYKINVYYPFLDHVLSELAARFSNHHEKIGNLQILIPKFMKNKNDAKSKLTEIHKMYLVNEKLENLLCEYQLWTKKWEGISDDLNEFNAIKTLEKCDKQFFPLIYNLLKILATLPVSTASAERSFSTLKRLKTYLRNAIGQERLTGLTLLNIYRDVTVDPLLIVNKLTQRRKRLNLLV
ncbi:52 kDa repressor of the inhibitor of the protein kinase-like [Metopolophium dirhodum]|uniref:52 kDa repressor of the inhibitor of the protein kinase-like n=1 Tax=Metopolophium dirhodum TaxID=44670 RepID=UPI0029900283|nr:52 kDa repressor of the inhibitor of the protein kinase-like [Metopolophium dirhodum]